jgi:putative restriction endonuclease
VHAGPPSIRPPAFDAVWLPDKEADQAESENDGSFVPQEGDRRELVQRQIRERRGQQAFRDSLRRRYGDRCLVSGCEILAVLEAAHIMPYRGEDDNDAANGLLLRADIHTLFDLNLIAIEPDQLQVKLHPCLINEYGHLAGRILGCKQHRRPSQEALRARYKLFEERINRKE